VQVKVAGSPHLQRAVPIAYSRAADQAEGVLRANREARHAETYAEHAGEYAAGVMRARGVELSLNPAPFYWRICFGTMLMDLAQAFIFDVGWFLLRCLGNGFWRRSA